MKGKIKNLGRTNESINLSEIRVLLCSIFPYGMVWSYPGYSNTKISTVYQSIRMFENDSITSGGRGGIHPRQAQISFFYKSSLDRVPCFSSNP